MYGSTGGAIIFVLFLYPITTNTLNTVEMIPLTNFHVFIMIKSPFLSIYNLEMGIIGMLVAYINGV